MNRTSRRAKAPHPRFMTLTATDLPGRKVSSALSRGGKTGKTRRRRGGKDRTEQRVKCR